MPRRALPKVLQEVAEKELNEVPSRVQADLDHIRQWISQQPHLKARTDDQWLLSFLRGSKFSLQRTKEKLDSYYTVRNLQPELHTNRDPFLPEIQRVLEAGTTVVLPKTANPTAPRVFVSRFHTLNPETTTLDNYLKVMLMIGDILMMEDDTFTVIGESSFNDLQNLPYSFITQVTPTFIEKIVTYMKNVYPIRFKEVYYFNTPSAIATVFNVVKMLLPEKLRNRIFFYKGEYSETSETSKIIPVSILPKDYGGEEVSCDELAAYWKAKVESYREWFLEDDQFGTDETKRLGKPKMSNDMFGAEGSFVKLEID